MNWNRRIRYPKICSRKKGNLAASCSWMNPGHIMQRLFRAAQTHIFVSRKAQQSRALILILQIQRIEKHFRNALSQRRALNFSTSFILHKWMGAADFIKLRSRNFTRCKHHVLFIFTRMTSLEASLFCRPKSITNYRYLWGKKKRNPHPKSPDQQT